MQNAELLQAREDLETSLQTYTDLYDFAPVGYITLDRNGEIGAVNLCGAGYLGIERASLLGRCFMQFVAVDYRSAFAAFLDMVFISQGKQTCEVALLNKGNLQHIVQIEAMATASGQGCRLVLIDITKRKRLDTELRYSEHLFRTLANNAPVNISRYDRQGRIVYLNPRLETILQRPLADLLGKNASEASPDGVFDALEKVILDVAVTGEDTSFEQILPNDDGPRSHLLHLTAERESGGEITGVGIAPENMKKLFQPLFTTKAKGIGLGLVVCKNLVEANGGRIEVESKLGKGTTFTVMLPTENCEA